jgi:tRNA (mo5U34)-methyltransferase
MAVKEALGPTSFEWYPYDTLSNIQHLDQLLDAERQASLIELARSGGVLDVGCQDGELAFLFESLGCRVTAIDHAATSHNGMLGVRALKQALNSSVEVHEVDVDSQFALPDPCYGVTLFLGTLYHLKNPYYAMEALAQRSNYCLLSTRIARRLSDGTAIPAGAPVAYLLDACELNNDDSNYWIFSEAALGRLIKRSGWEVLESMTVGDKLRSDPVSLKSDERAFYLLRSHYGLAHLNLIAGWHATEQRGWRWTAREFSIGLPEDAESYDRLTMEVFIPAVLIERLGHLTLRATFEGRELRPALFDKPGTHSFVRRLRKSSEGERIVHFSLDRALRPGDLDSRELGIIVASIEVE